MSNEYSKKAEFVNGLCDLLLTDPRSNIELLHYEPNNEYNDEVVHVCYRGGHHVKLLVTGTSIGFIAKEIINEVYK